MKILIAIIAVLLIAYVIVLLNLRQRIGEDIQIANDTEVKEVVDSIRYARDPRTNLCFAILAQNTNGYRTTFSIATVPTEFCK